MPDKAGEITRVAEGFRGQLARSEGTAQYSMVAQQRAIIAGLHDKAQALQGRIEARLASGGTIPVSWLHRQDAYHALIIQAKEQYDAYGGNMILSLGRAQDEAVRLAEQSTRATLLAQVQGSHSIIGTTIARLPNEAIRQITGTLETGSPLRSLIDGFGGAMAYEIDDALVTGLASGMHPNQITKDILNRVDGVSAARTQTIVRTELYRSFREANRATMQANAHVTDAWIWSAHLGVNTCAACLAMNGTEHPLSESMGSHPNCRCTMLPKTKTWEELGFPGIPETRVTADDVGDGEAWLRSQSPEAQRLAFGNNKLWAGWDKGEYSLGDTVRVVHNPKWGTTRTIGGYDHAASAGEKRLAAREAERLARQRVYPTTLEHAHAEAQFLGAPKVPRTPEEAIEGRLARIRQTRPDFMSDPKELKKWKKTEIGYMKDEKWFDDLDEGFLTHVQNGINDNYRDPRWKTFTDKYGGDYVIARRQPAGTISELGRRGTSYTEIFQPHGRLLNDALAGQGEWKLGALRHAPGEDISNLSAIIRHEFGHEIEGKLSAEARARIYAALPSESDIAGGLTRYAATKEKEAFCEAFALLTEPGIDLAEYPAWVREFTGVIKKEIDASIFDTNAALRAVERARPPLPAWAEKALKPIDGIATSELTEAHISEVGKGIEKEVTKRIQSSRYYQLDTENQKLYKEFDTLNKRIYSADRKMGKIIERDGYYFAKDNPEYIALDNAHTLASERIATVRARIYEIQHELPTLTIESPITVTKDVLKEIRPGYGEGRLTLERIGTEPESDAIIDEAIKSLPKEWVDSFNASGRKLRSETVERAYFDSVEARTGVGNVEVMIPRTAYGIEHQTGVGVHELTHFAEWTRPQLMQAEREFYARRTAGEQLEWLGGSHQSFEQTRRDKFLHAYMGKDYGGDAFELATMGVQSLFESGAYNAVDLSKDKDMYRFILGMLGVL